MAFSLQWLLLLQSTGSRCAGFSSCGSRALEHRLRSCGAWAQLLGGMWDPPGPGSDGTHVRWILNPCTTMEVPHSYTLNLGLTKEGGSEHLGQDLDHSLQENAEETLWTRNEVDHLIVMSRTKENWMRY